MKMKIRTKKYSIIFDTIGIRIIITKLFYDLDISRAITSSTRIYPRDNFSYTPYHVI